LNNPYSAPNAELSELSDDDTYEPKIFSLNGRIGRLRYLGYSWALGIPVGIIFGIIAAVLMPALGPRSGARGSAGFSLMMFVVYVPVIVIGLILARRRLHDLDHSGWFAVLAFVPLANILFYVYVIFFPGTKGQNNFGLKPKENPAPLWLVALVMPLFFVGVLAAVAIPAYQQYTIRAKALRAQQLQQQQAPQDQQAPVPDH
jgi:uncharacterized membrane protein YhaH (DUF805 family)